MYNPIYYPYLRAKQFELLAIREFAQEEGNKYILPILEPVRSTFSSFDKALSILVDNKLPLAVILNPQVGELIGKTHIIEEHISNELKNSTIFHPTYIIHNQTNYRQLITDIENKKYNNVILILNNSVDTDNEYLEQICLNENVTTIITEIENNRRLRKKITNTNKSIVLLKDKFNNQKRNSDYLTQDDEFFSDEHSYYLSDNYTGFSDYATVGKDFIEGGRLPYAIAIHLTYQKNEDEIWIKHFVSDTNFTNSDIQGKFGEAAQKAIKFLDENEIYCPASDELRKYYNNGSYPGLGMVKKISIKNHLELVNNLLTKVNN